MGSQREDTGEGGGLRRGGKEGNVNNVKIRLLDGARSRRHRATCYVNNRSMLVRL